jgi:hypothetical protein
MLLGRLIESRLLEVRWVRSPGVLAERLPDAPKRSRLLRPSHALYRPIAAQAQLELRLFASAMIFVSRLESRPRQERVAPFGSVRRNISRTC